MSIEIQSRPLRGRRPELSAIRSALATALEGRASAVALVGEPGIGKSRLASEAAALATQSGFSTRWGRAWEAGGAPAYWPWRQLCEGLPRDGAIAQLWGGHTGVADADQARFEVFDALTRALGALAAERPVLCILDDLHAADVPSLELLAFATRHLRACRLAWLLVWRDAESSRAAVRDQIARIAREATVLPLRPLLEVEANELIDDVRSDATIELRNKLVHVTAGNPLFLLETLAALAIGHITLGDDQLPLAQGIAALVADRLAPLASEVRELATAASVVGRDVSLARWAAAAARDVEHVRSAAAALVGTGVLLALGPDRWRFGHDLVREAIYRAAGSDASVIHRRLAFALDAEIAAGDVSLAGERAHHGLRANVPTRTALDWTIAAADHARAQCAYEEAASVIERAIAWVGPDAERDAALQLARGRALLDLDPAAAREALFAATSLARKAGDMRLLAEIALAFGSRYVFGDTSRELVALLDQATAALPEDEIELHARLLARKAAALTPALDLAPVLEMARRASEMIASSSDDAVRLEVAVAVGASFASMIHPREAIPMIETIVELARRRGDRALELRGLTRLVADHALAGDLAASDSMLAPRNALARALVQPRFAWTEPLLRSMRAMIRGDFAICDAAVAEAETYRTYDPNAVRTCAVHRAWLYIYSDRVDKLREHEPIAMDALATMTSPIRSMLRAVTRLRAGEVEEARREVEAIDSAHHQSHGTTGLATLGEVVAELGPDSRRRDIYERLAPIADTYAGWGMFGFVLGPPIAATLGCLAASVDDQERARAHFESALAMTTASGAIVGRAWTGFWYGRTLARLGDPAAARVLEDAARDATRANLDGLVTRCRSIATSRPTLEPVQSRPVAPPAATRWSLLEHAGSWRIDIADRSFLVPSLRGMPILARLAASPHVEIHSLELVSGSSDPELAEGDAGELLDEKARAAYRKRIGELVAIIDDAEARGDARRAEAAQSEHAILVKELSRAVGLRGRARRAGAATERARVAAHRRLREAIKKIAELDTELGAHLDKAIRTGTFCVYRP